MLADYNKNIGGLIQLLQTHLLKCLTGQPLDIVYWTKSFSNLYRSIRDMEKRAGSPKLAKFCSELADFLGIHSRKPPAKSRNNDIKFIEERSYERPRLAPIIERARRHRSQIRIGNRRQSSQSYDMLNPKFYNEYPSAHKHSNREIPRLCRDHHRENSSLFREKPKQYRNISNKIANMYNPPNPKNAEAYDIYHNRAMWNLNKNTMAYF